MVFAVGFLFVGLFLAVVSLDRDVPAGADILRDIGGAFALFGILIASIRVGATVDRQRRIVTTWWGLVVPFQKSEHPLSQVQYVTLSRENRQVSAGYSYDVFPVRLEAAGADAITLREPRDYDDARRLAEEIAKFVRLELRVWSY